MIPYAKILLTIAAIQYGVGPLIADLTESHVFHIDWPPHARFHMVWLLAMGSGIAAFIVYLVWSRSENERERLKMAAILGALILAGFFVATFTQQYYGGALSDPEHEKLIFGINANMASFSLAALFQTIAMALIWRTDDQSS